MALIYTNTQKVGRACLVGFIVFLVVLLWNILNPFWGGVFAMFPATFSSILLSLHRYYGSESLFPTMQKIPIGSLSIFTYAIVSMFVFPKCGFIFGTIVAYVVSLVVTLLLVKLQSRK